MPKKLKISPHGAFRSILGRNQILMKLDEPTTLKEVIQKVSAFFPPESKHALIDPELNDPRPNALILVNGKEIGVLNGLDTKVSNGDEIVLIPISHGG
ncbi:MAG: MoaD/ThiS family protein [Candidatus Bathyarchaeia archaeon]